MTLLSWRKSSLAVAAVIGACLAPAASKAQSPSGIDIFYGAGVNAGLFRLAGWGSGTIAADTHDSYIGSESLNIKTQGYYQGGSIDLKNPVSLAPYLSNPNAYLQFTIKQPLFAQRSGYGGGMMGGYGGPGGMMGPGGPGGMMGGPGGMMGRGGPGGMMGRGGPGGMPGGPGGMMGRGGAGGMYGRRGGYGAGAGNYQTKRATPLTSLRVQIVTTSGASYEELLPLKYAVSHNNWQVVSIPVDAIKGITPETSSVKVIRIFGNGPGSLLIGKISVAVDASPLSDTQMDEQVVATKQFVRYQATATAGTRPVKFSWDWDASDGIQSESTGRTVYHAYYLPGDYKVTVTASDPYTNRVLGHITFNVHVHN